MTIADNLTVAKCQIDHLNIGSYNDVARRIFISGVEGTNLRIEESTAGHAINLSKAKFKSISFNNCDLNCEIETSDVTCDKLILEKCRFGGQVDLRQLTFDEINLDGSRIQSTLLLNLKQILTAKTGRFQKFRSKYDTPSKIETAFKGDYDKAINTLFLLRENFRHIPTLSKEEDYCAYRLFNLHRRNSNVFFRWVYKRLFGYMLLPSRVLLTAAGIIAAFSVLYSLLPSEGLFLDNKAIEWPRDFLTSIYFSVVTFTTLGYGDIHPVGALRILSIIESLLGPFFVAMFTVALGRKILRW